MNMALYKIDEVADLLNIKASTLRSWILQGKLPVVKLGRAVRIRSDVVEGILNSGLEGVSCQQRKGQGKVL